MTNQPFTSEHFLNRELSWLEFNQRVLDEALDVTTPLLERLKFFCITSSNLDEFFEVRVAGLKQQIESKVATRSVDGLTPSETLKAVAARVREMVDLQYTCWREQLEPQLTRNGIRFLKVQELTGENRTWVAQFYRTEVLPVLTPLAIDPAHPFPQLLNKSLNIIVQLEKPEGARILRHLAVVQVPRVLPRLVRLPRSELLMDYVFLGNIIGQNLAELFPGTNILGYWLFRVTRNSELYIDEQDTAPLLKAIETQLHNRRKGAAVRLEAQKGCPAEIIKALRGTLRLEEDDVYILDGPLSPAILMRVYEGDHSPQLRDPPFVPPVAAVLREKKDIFKAIREGDILLHHPYDNFSSVVDFLEQAANDPKVLAVKQTLYRTGGDPRIIGALMRAVQNGKQVTAVVELRARFDEANNIEWARQLEENGVHVVYGFVGYKIHSKICLVVRRDDEGIRRYVHVATGNYNPTTARLYTDIGLFTSKAAFGEDATQLFNLLTGISQYQGSQRFLVAPFDLRQRLLDLIQREIVNAQNRLPARIIAKINSLVDEHIIEALYRASQAGVKIDLIVRGICCLRAGVKGVSENISVRSIVDRFLEHSRIFYFDNACRPEVFLSSADWMPRNLYRRIELAIPIEDGNLRERIIAELLALPLADNIKARCLLPDGSYVIPARDAARPVRSQSEFIERALRSDEEKDRKPQVPTPYVKMKLATPPAALRRKK